MNRLVLLGIVTLFFLPRVNARPQGKIVDLTEGIHEGMVAESVGKAAMELFGIHEVRLEPEMNFQKTTGRSTFLETSTQIGTHMDAGAHVDPNGWTVDKVELDRLISPGVLVDLRSKTSGDPITPRDFEKYKIRPGDSVVLFFNYQPPRPGELYSQAYLTEEAAQWLVEHRVQCVASNTPGLENLKRAQQNHWTDPANQKIAWPVHKILLGAKIPIVEGLTNLDQLIGHRFEFIVLPLKIVGVDGSPVRAIAILDPPRNAPAK